MTEKVDIMRPTSNVQRPTSNVQPNLFQKSLITFLKIIVSGIFALLILTLLCSFYYNVPQHHADPAGATDYKFEPDTFFAFGREGFSYGRTNNEGYNDSSDYIKGMPVQILVTGSSHMEALHVMRKKNAASLLAELSDRFVYNIGTSAHTFITCAVNLESALRKYTPSEYVIIETASVNFSDKELERIISKNVSKIPAYDKGILSVLRRNNFLRLMYHQFPVLLKSNMTSRKKSEQNDSYNSKALLTEVLRNLAHTASSYGIKLIIAYHPSISLNKDGTISINGDLNIVRQFSELCAQNGIYFLDMSKRFLDEYKKNYTLPYGFMNTSVGSGHMNKYGHKMLAEEIYGLIQRIEEK